MNQEKKKKSVKRELIEWGIFFGVVIFLYGTGLHTTVLGGIQGLFLKTGVMSPSLMAEKDQRAASYQIPLTDLEGKAVDISALKGKVIFLNFWATWCPPCIAEMPEIAGLYEDVASEDIAFVMVSVDRDFEKLEKFVQKKEYKFPIYRLSGSLPSTYEASSIPTTYLISPSGKIIMEKTGMGSYNNEGFKEVLKEAGKL